MKTEKKLTAVEWLVNHFCEYGIDYGFFIPIIKEAKEKEKQQIIDTYDAGYSDGMYETGLDSGKEYYNQTFKND